MKLTTVSLSFSAGFSQSRALFRKKCGALANIRIGRLNSHDTHSNSVVIIDILLTTRNYYMHTEGVEFKATKLFKLSDINWIFRNNTVVQVNKQRQHLTWSRLYDANIVFLLLFQLFPACCYVAKICRSSCEAPCGGPVLWRPVFGRTCWTCLNAPVMSLWLR